MALTRGQLTHPHVALMAIWERLGAIGGGAASLVADVHFSPGSVLNRLNVGGAIKKVSDDAAHKEVVLVNQNKYLSALIYNDAAGLGHGIPLPPGGALPIVTDGPVYARAAPWPCVQGIERNTFFRIIGRYNGTLLAHVSSAQTAGGQASDARGTGGVYKSTDGLNWRPVFGGISWWGDLIELREGRIAVGGARKKNDGSANFETVISYSDDQGDTWSVPVIGTFESNNLRSASFHSGASNSRVGLFATVQAGIAFTVDNGVTWNTQAQSTYTDAAKTEYRTYKVIMNPADDAYNGKIFIFHTQQNTADGRWEFGVYEMTAVDVGTPLLTFTLRSTAQAAENQNGPHRVYGFRMLNPVLSSTDYPFAAMVIAQGGSTFFHTAEVDLDGVWNTEAHGIPQGFFMPFEPRGRDGIQSVLEDTGFAYPVIWDASGGAVRPADFDQRKGENFQGWQGGTMFMSADRSTKEMLALEDQVIGSDDTGLLFGTKGDYNHLTVADNYGFVDLLVAQR